MALGAVRVNIILSWANGAKVPTSFGVDKPSKYKEYNFKFNTF